MTWWFQIALGFLCVACGIRLLASVVLLIASWRSTLKGIAARADLKRCRALDQMARIGGRFGGGIVMATRALAAMRSDKP
jgi:hypothetical protein